MLEKSQVQFIMSLAAKGPIVTDIAGTYSEVTFVDVPRLEEILLGETQGIIYRDCSIASFYADELKHSGNDKTHEFMKFEAKNARIVLNGYLKFDFDRSVIKHSICKYSMKSSGETFHALFTSAQRGRRNYLNMY
jgi:hypothetical protein